MSLLFDRERYCNVGEFFQTQLEQLSTEDFYERSKSNATRSIMGKSYTYPYAIFLQSLPARWNEGVTAGIIDGSQSRIFDQVENRLHAQKALLYLRSVERTKSAGVFSALQGV